VTANRAVVAESVAAELVGHETSAITERIYMRLHDRPQTFEQVRQALTPSLGYLNRRTPPGQSGTETDADDRNVALVRPPMLESVVLGR
jgi:hypothetical protein